MLVVKSLPMSKLFMFHFHVIKVDRSIFPRPPICQLATRYTQRNVRYLLDEANLTTQNSLTRPQLLAVSATSNRQKGDKDPAEWLPELESYQCEYARAWIQVKQYYGLSVDSLEKAALGDILDGVC
jgi:hypothetical protein